MAEIIYSVPPNEYVVSSFLNPKYCKVIESTFGYSEHNLASQMERIFHFHKFQNELLQANDNLERQSISNHGRNDTFQSWLERNSMGVHISVSRMSNRSNSFRGEVVDYISAVSSRVFTREESLQFWIQTEKNGCLPRLLQLFTLFRNVPASCIPQERRFSELKRRCNGLRGRTQIETLDRDAVVYA